MRPSFVVADPFGRAVDGGIERSTVSVVAFVVVWLGSLERTSLCGFLFPSNCSSPSPQALTKRDAPINPRLAIRLSPLLRATA